MPFNFPNDALVTRMPGRIAINRTLDQPKHIHQRKSSKRCMHNQK